LQIIYRIRLKLRDKANAISAAPGSSIAIAVKKRKRLAIITPVQLPVTKVQKNKILINKYYMYYVYAPINLKRKSKI
jgi:hypothetical protein